MIEPLQAAFKAFFRPGHHEVGSRQRSEIKVTKLEIEAREKDL